MGKSCQLRYITEMLNQSAQGRGLVFQPQANRSFECNNWLPFSHTRSKLNRPGNQSSHHSSISPLKLTRVFDF